MKKISLFLYRHKERKDIFLVRNWSICGGTEDTDFYKATIDIIEAVRSASLQGRMNENFDHWFNSFLDNNGKTKLVVKVQEKKEFEFDGYKGTATKEIVLRVADFEKVELSEVTEE
jgi:hypothetical protein